MLREKLGHCSTTRPIETMRDGCSSSTICVGPCLVPVVLGEGLVGIDGFVEFGITDVDFGWAYSDDWSYENVNI